jgi:hypothetical protein
LSAAPQNLERGRSEGRFPRFLTGAFAGITTGIALGITAALLITVAQTVTAGSVEQELQDTAPVIFGVLAGLTIASWGLIMRGLTAHPPVANAGVE